MLNSFIFMLWARKMLEIDSQAEVKWLSVSV